jgi:hypothetical protein
MRTAADATMGSVKIHLLRNRGDGGVVIACVIKHKVADSTGVDTELLQRLANNFSHLLAAMSARQLRQRDRQVLEVAVAVDVVRNNA